MDSAFCEPFGIRERLFPALGHGERDPLDRLNIGRDGMFTAVETQMWSCPFTRLVSSRANTTERGAFLSVSTFLECTSESCALRLRVTVSCVHVALVSDPPI